MSDKIRLASVGLGRWAQVLANALQRSEVVEINSCFTRDETKRNEFQAKYGVPKQAATLEELLADDEVEGVIVTTPNDTHLPVITQCLEAGKAVYTEKPISMTLSDGVRIANAARDTGQVFAVGHSARRLSGSRVMKQWIDDGSIGGVSMAEANFSNERALELTPNDWRWYADKAPGGPLIQLGVHHADNLQYLMGRVASVRTVTKRVFTKAEVPDAVMTILEFESGALGYLGTGWASASVYSINLQGTKANLRYDVDFTYWDDSDVTDQHSTLLAQQMGQASRTPLELPPTDMYLEQLEEFAKAIRGEAEVEVGGKEALDALAVVHAGVVSASRDGAPVTLDEVIGAAGA